MGAHAKDEDRKPRVLMLGPDPNLVYGGVVSVIHTILATPVAEQTKMDVFPVKETEEATQGFRAKTRKIVSMAWRYVTRLRREQPDVLHIHASAWGSFWPMSGAAWVGRLHRIPYIMHIHSGELAEFVASTGPLKRWWMARTLRLAAKIILVSPKQREILSEVSDPSNMVVIQNAVAYPEMEPRLRDRSPVKALFAGYVGKRKGIPELVKACALLEKRSDAAELEVWIAGAEEHPGEWEEMQAIYKQAGGQNPNFLGLVDRDRLLELYREADMFVLPSHAEGLPITVLEAMAAALPVVTTPVGGLPSALGSDQAVFAQPGDVDGLADAMDELAKDPQRRHDMGAANLAAYKERYSVRRYGCELTAVYAELFPPAGGPRE